MHNDEDRLYVNGNRITVLETLVGNLVKAVEEQNGLLQKVVGPEGVCPRERAANLAFRETTRAHIRGLWTAMIFLATAYCTLIVVLIKAA